MSPRSWEASLRQIAEKPERVAIVGGGHELCGDDAAGLLVSRHLASGPTALVIEAGPAPENVGFALRKFAPEAILLVDAAILGLAPGSIVCLEAAGLAGVSASSHTLPLDVVAAFWKSEFSCDVFLFGIQPTTTEFGAPLSSPVVAAARVLASTISATLALPFVEIRSFPPRSVRASRKSQVQTSLG